MKNGLSLEAPPWAEGTERLGPLAAEPGELGHASGRPAGSEGFSRVSSWLS